MNATIEKIRELLRKATKGPWDEVNGDIQASDGEYVIGVYDGETAHVVIRDEDRELICLLRNNIESLLLERERHVKALKSIARFEPKNDYDLFPIVLAKLALSDGGSVTEGNTKSDAPHKHYGFDGICDGCGCELPKSEGV